MPQLPQLGFRQRAIAVVMVVKHVDQRRFPGWLHLGYCCRGRAFAPRVVAAGHNVQRMVEQVYGVSNTLLVNEL